MPSTAFSPSPAAANGGGLTLPKAQVINVDSGAIIECMFNPKEYSISKKNNWGPPKSGSSASGGTNVPQQQYKGGDPASLTLQLFFDTYVGAHGSKDVRKEYTSKIWALAEPAPRLADNKTTKSRPPKVRFQWGPAWSFVAVITSIKQKFTLFSADGTPVRATLDVTFQQISDDSQLAGTNPTSGGIGGERQWTVKHGDTLASIAYETLGDAGHWRAIADANRLSSVRDLRPGMQLGIPASA